MPRVKTGVTRRRRHKEVLKATKGFRLSIGRHYKVSKQALLHADQYAYIGRRLKKRDMRRLWIQRINAGLSGVENGPNYSSFIKQLKDKQIVINRKLLAELAVNDNEAFKAVVKLAGEK